MRTVNLWSLTVSMTLLHLCGLVLPWSSSAFSIVAPSDMTLVTSGQSIPVRVDIGAGTGIRQIRFYWYREGEEPLSSRQARLAFSATAASVPPFGGQLIVPLDGIGLMRLLAVAEVARGRLAGREEFDERLLRVEPGSELRSIEFEAEKPWRLKTIGRVAQIPVVGQFADGVVRPLGGTFAGSAFRSSDLAVVQVLPGGLVRVVGNGTASLIVENRGSTGTLSIVVNADTEPNEWPLADAGSDMTVKSGDPVALNGFNSMDPDGDPLRYRWTQVRGHRVALLDPGMPRARFVAPNVSERRLLTFRLQVTDMAGADTIKGADSPPAFVNVWVEP